MELFIIGGIIVALMVYVSTKIKKNAAEAYDREVVVTDRFRLVKPEGFLHPLRDDSIFEAYSKDFGEGELRNVWRANAEITIVHDRSVNELVEETKASSSEVISERSESGDLSAIFIETEISVDDAEKRQFTKILRGRNDGEIYVFKAFVLSEHLAEFRERIIEMLESLTLEKS